VANHQVEIRQSFVTPHRATSLRPKKSLGQNFLRDENISRKIVASVAPSPNDVVLEVGPGEGALTKYLAQGAHKLIVVDIDTRVTKKLHEMYPAGEITILNEDFLTIDLEEIARREKQRLRIVGNIPYNITSPILFHVLDQSRAVADATLMVQKEVARRIVAVPHTKDYGILAVFCQLSANVKLLFDVSPNAFYPKPKVTSSVVRLTILPALKYKPADEQFFRRMVRSIFGKRRKTLRNSLSYFAEAEGMAMSARVQNIDLQQRPENLTLEELVRLSNALNAAGT
jgi:16S rRNA (adenine1518-N6/adenine1519-N6)-dimethyltransferase